MIFVKVPKEIKNYETHLALNLTFKQWVYLGVSFLLSITIAGISYLFTSSTTIVSYIVIFFTIPGLAFGFIKPMDLTFDVYIRYVVNFYRRKQKLTYDNELCIYEKKKGVSNKNEIQQTRTFKEKWNDKRTNKKRIRKQNELKETYVPEGIKN